MKHFQRGVLVRTLRLFQVLTVVTAAAMDQIGISPEQLGSKNERVLFDVSGVNNLKASIQNGTLSEIYSQETLEPVSFYYDLKADLDECQFWMSSQNNLGKINETCSSVERVAVIVNGNAKIKDLLSLSKYVKPFTENSTHNLLKSESEFLESITISLAYKPSEHDCSEHLQKLSMFLGPKKTEGENARVKIGVELNTPFLINCQKLQESHLLRTVDHAILQLDLSNDTSILSYGLFLERITLAIIYFKEYMKRFNPYPSFFIQISVVENGINEGLTMEYLKAWINEKHNHTNQGKLIIKPTTTNFAVAGNYKFLQENMTLGILAGKNSVFSQNSRNHINSESAQILKTMYSVVDNLLLVNPPTSFFAGNQFADEMLPQSSNETRQGCMSVLFTKDYVSLAQVSNTTNQLWTDKEKLNICAIYIDSAYKGMPDRQLILEPMKSAGVRIGCYVQVLLNRSKEQGTPELSEQVAQDCGDLWDVATHVLMNVSLRVERDDNFIDNLFELLSMLREKKLEIEMDYPLKTVVPMLRIISANWGLKGKLEEHSFNFDSLIEVVYCRPRIKRLNEYYQAIMTFARIHQWNDLVLMPASDSPNDFVLWRNAETDESIDRSATNFPLLYRSNSEKSVILENLPETYPCIHYSGDPRNEEKKSLDTNFLNQRSGATFSAKLRKELPLSEKELETVLYLSLKQFSFVEMRQVNEHELKQIDNIASESFLEKIKSSRKAQVELARPLIYFEIGVPEAEDLKHSIRNIMAPHYDGIMAVHFSQWENSTDQQLESVHSMLETESLSSNFGITIQNCSLKMNMGLANLKSLPFMSRVRYVVCNVKPVLPTNANAVWMQKYLDTLFYTKSYMEKRLTSSSLHSIEFMFRINLDSAAKICEDSQRFLYFLNDVRQHSKAFKIKYFIVTAFERKELAKPCPNAWWSITSYADLTKTSVYRETALKTKENMSPPNSNTHQPSGDSNTNIYLMTILPVSALFILLGAFLLWFQRRYYQKSFLTQREVDNFYKASLMSGDGMELANTDEPNCEYIKFPDNYEIAARDIEIQEEVGRGQFGVVHLGMLKKKDEVAIKVPRSDCTKEEFVSALSELKILCYVGTHPNIVSFLGAHTKNIRRGKLLIVTEFCGKGSLESYLRGLVSDGRHDLNQLYEFAHQIAAGMEYLAEKRIIHGDLATRNVLLTADFTCKISDFGLSRRLYEVSVYVKRGNEALPWMWMAPESLRDMEFTTKSDVWSYAVTLWEIFTLGKLPYPGRRLTHAFIMELESGIRMERAQLASEMIHEKMLECWSLAQEDRPTFTELKQYFLVLGSHHYQNTTNI